jgi:PPM family protein phosphatase
VPGIVRKIIRPSVAKTTKKEVIPESNEQNSDETKPPSAEKVQMEASWAWSIGQLRSQNEDALFCLTSIRITYDGALPFGLYIVADGMGGHKNGEKASSLAVHVFSHYVTSHLFSPLLAYHPEQPSQSIQEIMEGGVQAAQQAILRDVNGGGTTLTAVLILGEQMTLVHVGDSRAYWISDQDETVQLTRDHSLVNRLLELGQITPEEAVVHPQKNVLYRALGQPEAIIPDLHSAALPSSGYLLLCSDGLWGVVPEDEIKTMVRSTPSLRIACQHLVEAANLAGGPDNITAILVRLPEAAS